MTKQSDEEYYYEAIGEDSGGRQTRNREAVFDGSGGDMLRQTMVPKSKWAAFWLNFFFGALGASKFYEGKIGLGILYLLTFGIFGIGVIVDFFRYLFSSNPYYVPLR